MKVELEYLHDSDSGKVWIAELKDKDILVKFGKKGSNLQEKISSFKNKEEAKDEFNKKLKEKLNKGYQYIEKNGKEPKKVSKKQKSNIMKKKIEVVNPFINYLIQLAEKYNEKQEKLWENDDSDEDKYDKEMEKFHDKNKETIINNLKKFHSKKVMPFFKSGVITKNITDKLRKDLLNSINSFANKIPVDYHPGSNNRVRDIVHPSLYPLILKEKKNNNQNVDFWNRLYESSKFQWLPSEFKIDSEGNCKIESYINNLPETEKELYNNIEKAFTQVLPYFEDCWSYINALKLYEEEDEWMDYSGDGFYEQINLKNKTLQVITKVVQISLKDNDNFPGSWHVEGMSHENIVATATITLEQDNDFNAELYFKRIYTLAEAAELVQSVPQNPYNTIRELFNILHVPLGKVDIKQSNIVVFPNSHIHQINMSSLTKKEQTRTILVFWLINPNVRITSTKDIKQQNYDIKKAHQNRLELMKERTYYKQTFNQRDLNLCEH